MERAIWELDAQASLDVPEFSGAMMPFDKYREENFDGEGFDPDGVVLAFDGDRLVGFCGTKVEAGEAAGESPGRIGHTWFLGVARSHRRRGIAAALKVLTVRWAGSRGLSRLTTNNNLENEGIIGVNERLGYVVTSNAQYVRKQL